MYTQPVLYRGGVYRMADLGTLAERVVGYLWKWIEKLGLSKDQVLNTIRNLFSPFLREGAEPAIPIPRFLVKAVAELLAKRRISLGDFMAEVAQALENPGPGYRWEVDEWGEEHLVKVRSKVPEHGIVRGKKFAGKVLIGIWWATDDWKKSSHKRLIQWIRGQNGDVFLRRAMPPAGESREYGGFIIVPEEQAEVAAARALDMAERASEHEDGRSRLSAVSLNGLASGKEIKLSDQYKMPGLVNSIKFNWDYNLTDVLNGRVNEYKETQEYRDLVQMLRSARDA